MHATMDKRTDPGASREIGHGISFGEAFRVWLRVAVLSFGGPAGQIAVMHRILVEEKNWISEGRFLHALNYCMLLPGPEAQQLATSAGYCTGPPAASWPAACSSCPALSPSWA
jgi:chromate transporter